MSNDSLRIYGVPFSVHTRKVILAARHKSIPHVVQPIVPVLPDTLPAAWRTISPTGLIPAVDDGGFRLADSTAIVLYLDKKHPAPALLPPWNDRLRARALPRRMGRGIAVPGDHPFSRLLGAKEGATEIDIKYGVPFLQVQIDRMADGLAAGIVDQHVDAARSFIHQPEQVEHVLPAGDIRLMDDDVYLVITTELFGQRMGIGLIPEMIDQQSCAARCHGPGNTGTDAPAAARDKNPFIFQLDGIVHC